MSSSGTPGLSFVRLIGFTKSSHRQIQPPTFRIVYKKCSKGHLRPDDSSGQSLSYWCHQPTDYSTKLPHKIRGVQISQTPDTSSRLAGSLVPEFGWAIVKPAGVPRD